MQCWSRTVNLLEEKHRTVQGATAEAREYFERAASTSETWYSEHGKDKAQHSECGETEKKKKPQPQARMAKLWPQEQPILNLEKSPSATARCLVIGKGNRRKITMDSGVRLKTQRECFTKQSQVRSVHQTPSTACSSTKSCWGALIRLEHLPLACYIHRSML